MQLLHKDYLMKVYKVDAPYFYRKSNKMEKQESIITINEAAEIMACTTQYVRQLIREEKIKPVPTVHPRYYLKLDDVLEIQKTMCPVAGRNRK